MKTFTSIILLFCFALAVYAQDPYSQENLENLSQEELGIYLDKALKLQKSGKTVTIVGGSILGATAVTIAGMALVASGDWALAAVVVAFFGGLAGVGTMAVGIPMNITGKKRVERINSLRTTAFNSINFKLEPCGQYNCYTQSYQPGVTLRITF